MSALPITGFRLDAVHTFQVRTLASLGYRTRVALSNASGTDPTLTTSYRVDVSVFGPSRKRERFFENIAALEPRKKVPLDCERFVEGYTQDVEVIFHLIPLRLAATAKDGLVDITRSELFGLMSVQDHYVEYYRDDGFSSGVLYQSGAFNYAKFSKDATTIIQAPKGYVAKDVDTIMSVLNSSLDPAYDKTAAFKCTLIAGDRRATWVESCPPFVPVSISMRDRAGELGISLGDEPRFVCFMGLCETATLIPLTINRDLKTGCIGIEHSLPPTYYASSVTGPLRSKVISQLSSSLIFQGAR
ncbi:MAG: hypothetical protein ACKV2T_39540 [Kofleriaceae bacterium]